MDTRSPPPLPPSPHLSSDLVSQGGLRAAQVGVRPLQLGLRAAQVGQSRPQRGFLQSSHRGRKGREGDGGGSGAGFGEQGRMLISRVAASPCRPAELRPPRRLPPFLRQQLTRLWRAARPILPPAPPARRPSPAPPAPAPSHAPRSSAPQWPPAWLLPRLRPSQRDSPPPPPPQPCWQPPSPQQPRPRPQRKQEPGIAAERPRAASAPAPQPPPGPREGGPGRRSTPKKKKWDDENIRLMQSNKIHLENPLLIK